MGMMAVSETKGCFVDVGNMMLMKSQFVISKYQKTLWSQFATLETTLICHFREVTKMIICSQNIRLQNHFVDVNKMVYMFGGKNG